MNVSSYALFGDNPFYWKPAMALVRAHHTLFPGWELRIHHDSHMDQAIGQLWRAYSRHQLATLVPCTTGPLCENMLWRLKPLWDPAVELTMCRDIDTLLTPKDRRMMDQFIASKAAFHLVNDSPSHNIPILGGMLAINGPIFHQKFNYPGLQSWENMITTFKADIGVELSWRGSDQFLLNYLLWDLAQQSLCEHRLQGYRPLEDAVASYTTVPNTPINANIKPELLAVADSLVPHLGSSGYDIDRAVDVYDRLGDTDVIQAIHRAEATVG